MRRSTSQSPKRVCRLAPVHFYGIVLPSGNRLTFLSLLFIRPRGGKVCEVSSQFLRVKKLMLLKNPRLRTASWDTGNQPFYMWEVQGQRNSAGVVNRNMSNNMEFGSKELL